MKKVVMKVWRPIKWEEHTSSLLAHIEIPVPETSYLWGDKIHEVIPGYLRFESGDKIVIECE